MGRSLKDLGNSVNELPYQIVEAQRQLIKVKIGENEYTPQELSAEILEKSEKLMLNQFWENLSKSCDNRSCLF